MVDAGVYLAPAARMKPRYSVFFLVSDRSFHIAPRFLAPFKGKYRNRDQNFWRVEVAAKQTV